MPIEEPTVSIFPYIENTFTVRGLSFFSFWLFNFKINSIKTLLATDFSICSTHQNFHEELVFLPNFLKAMVILLIY